MAEENINALLSDYPEGYGYWWEEIEVNGEIDRIYIEYWKSGNVWKWCITWASTGDSLCGTAPSREEAIRKACEAYRKEIEEFAKLVEAEEEFAMKAQKLKKKELKKVNLDNFFIKGETK